MSITPREPPSAVHSEAGEPRGSQSSSTRFAYRCWRVVCVATLWVLRGLRGVADRTGRTVTGDTPQGRGEPRGRGPTARDGIGGSSGAADGASHRAQLAGERGSTGRELPPRPDLEAEETEAGLKLRRPGQEEAYVTSDEWQEVHR